MVFTAIDRVLTARRGLLHRAYAATGGLLLLLLVLAATLTIVEPRFLNAQNLANVIRGASMLTIVATGQMLVLIVGGFDLSIGATMALSSVFSATIMASFGGVDVGVAIAAGVACGLLGGAAVGLLNGLCVAFFRVPPFMVTFGSASIAGGLALLLTNGIPVYGLPEPFVSGFGRALWLGLPSAFYVAVVLAAAIWILQNRTPAGIYIHAVGSSINSTTISGVPTRRYLIVAYVLSAMLAAVASLLLTGQIGSGQGSIGDALTFQSIAVAVIAGVSLRGGIGRVEKVAIAALFFQVMTNAMELLRVPSKAAIIVLGIVVILAVALENIEAKRAGE